MKKHSLTHAGQVFVGGAYDPVLYSENGRNGVEMAILSRVSLGAPIGLDADGMVAAATSTELPNAATITYTTATDGTSPLDNAATPAPSTITANGASRSVWALDVPRNITIAVTHNSSIVAMSVTVTGYDKYLNKMVETLSVTATGTSKTAAGKKAFKYIESMAVTSAGDATTNTLNVGWGDVLGLPFKVRAKNQVLQAWFNDVLETTAPTVVVGDATTASATTGDVRGTIDLNSACDGSIVVLYMHTDPTDRETLLGTAQYSG